MDKVLRWSKSAVSGCTQSRRSVWVAPEKLQNPPGASASSWAALRQPVTSSAALPVVAVAGLQHGQAGQAVEERHRDLLLDAARRSDR